MDQFPEQMLIYLKNNVRQNKIVNILFVLYYQNVIKLIIINYPRQIVDFLNVVQ